MTIQKMNEACDRLASASINVGYDQWQRWSFFNRATKELIANKEGDCSSTSGAIAALGGYPVNLSDPYWTGNFVERMAQAGFSSINVTGWGPGALYPALRSGDFLIGPGHVVYVREPNRWWSAEADEEGSSHGGVGGDQTGREARFREPYMRSRGWTNIVRPPASAPAEPLASSWPKPSLLAVDGELGPRTIRAMQAWAGAVPDGIWGPRTTRSLQHKVGARVDGIKGPETTRKLQSVVGARVDGEWGPDTTRKLQIFLNNLRITY